MMDYAVHSYIAKGRGGQQLCFFFTKTNYALLTTTTVVVTVDKLLVHHISWNKKKFSLLPSLV